MLVVDAYVLGTVHRLDFSEQVFLQGFVTNDAQQILRHQHTVNQGVAGFDAVTLVHAVMFALWNRVLDFSAGIATDDDDALAALTFTEVDNTVDFGHDCRVLRRTSFEELGDARQTTGDVVGTRDFARSRRQQSTTVDLLTFDDTQGRFFRHRIMRDRPALVVFKHHLRMQIALTFEDDAIDDAGDIVALFAHRHFGNDVLETNRSADIAENRNTGSFPFDDELALFEHGAIGHEHLRTDRYFKALDHAGVLIVDGEFAVTIENDLLFSAIDDDAEIFVNKPTGLTRLISSFFGLGVRHTTDVEGTHGELRARLANRLGGDDADRHTVFDGHAA